jgi:hypothetical protein
VQASPSSHSPTNVPDNVSNSAQETGTSTPIDGRREKTGWFIATVAAATRNQTPVTPLTDGSSPRHVAE